jgi:hypothetical protein
MRAHSSLPRDKERQRRGGPCRHDDGTEIEIRPGDAYVIQPGHDAWVVGSEVFVGYEVDSNAAETCATR